jgi:hypothetical protein
MISSSCESVAAAWQIAKLLRRTSGRAVTLICSGAVTGYWNIVMHHRHSWNSAMALLISAGPI